MTDTDTDKEPGTNVSETAEPRTTDADPPAGGSPDEPPAETDAAESGVDAGDDATDDTGAPGRSDEPTGSADGDTDDGDGEDAGGGEDDEERAADEPSEGTAGDSDDDGAGDADDSDQAAGDGEAEAATDDDGARDDEVEPDPSRSSGRVKVFDEERNYGFLQPLEGGRDIFVHASEVEDGATLRPGDVVEYDLTKTDDGPQATSVRILERAPEDNPAGRVVTGGAPPTWDQLERIQRDMRHQRRQRRRRR